ncbi:FGGY-family carbohydrate kinase [Photorhabdus heterorhabditis]|uniref:FGGY-family carbohydrate kinase n=1 Tax=Photorhabdus heterorhabditis TaxID=880156 RepID=UPI0015626B31|nr:FGGY-family carbohydrate kinase [Photorhabdus heterorhabditis]NRN27317.1 FGGY-family carbohydrate kinase [Photorhabdus heterorhabditis subsp. aluminescens]
MEQQYFIGVDVGSASVRTAIFDQHGKRHAFSVRPIQQFHPRAGFVEQSSTNIWEQVCITVKEAVTLANINPIDVKSIGFDATCSLVAVAAKGQSLSVAENGNPEHDIIMWMDHRALEETATINLTNDPALSYVGGEISPEMELPKILWLKNHFPQRYQNTWRFFDLADFLVWKATAVDVASICTLTCKWNYLAHQRQFSEKLLYDVGLENLADKVPVTILGLGEKAGHLTTEVAKDFGLHTGVVVAGGIIDAHAGGLALAGACPEGSLVIISGTSNCHMIVSPDPVMVPGVWGPYFSAMLPGYWLNEGGQSATGTLVEWTIRQHDSWLELEAEAKVSNRDYYLLLNEAVAQLEQREKYPTAQLHILSDHYGNRSPRANPNARGMANGLTLETGRDALARHYLATLQSIAYGTRHIIDALAEAGHQINKLAMCGGATKNPLWLREYANATGREIHLPQEQDAVNLGAALLGAVACGSFKDLTQAAKLMVHNGNIIKPAKETFLFHQAKYQVYLQMYQDQQRYNEIMQTCYTQ